MTANHVFVATAIRSWQQIVNRVANFCSNLSEDRLLTEIVPGNNRLIYLWGHLTAMHDGTFPVLRLGERLHPELDVVFVSQPDRSVPIPPAAEIKKYWDEVHAELFSRFSTLGPGDWLQRHGSVSAEEFDLDPTRNRLAVLLNRTNHASYHLGQMMLAQTNAR